MLIYEEIVPFVSKQKTLDFLASDSAFVTRQQLSGVLELSNVHLFNEARGFVEGKDFITLRKSDEPMLFNELIHMELAAYTSNRVSLYKIGDFIEACLSSRSDTGQDMRSIAIPLLKKLAIKSKTITSITNGRDAKQKLPTWD
jgi:hypothetical protein